MFILAGSAFLILLLLNSSAKIEKPHAIQVAYQEDDFITREIQGAKITSFSTPSPSPFPTIAPSPTNTPIKPTDIPTNDIGLKILRQINDFRAEKGLPAFSTDGYTCSFAVMRASEIASDFSHNGFRNRIDNKTLPYPTYSGISENIAMNSDPNAVVQGWIDSAGHNENLSKPHTFACIAKNGDYYVFLSWNP